MLKKIAILIPVLLLFFGLDNCRSPEGPEEPEPNYEYRYNVEVIYTRVAAERPENEDYVSLSYDLYDPAMGWQHNWTDSGSIEMNKIGKNEYRCYLPKVFIQNARNPDKHKVCVLDDLKKGVQGEKVIIQGAYDQEVKTYDFGTFINTYLHFKMSKE